MPDPALYILLVVTLGIGFLLGRREWRIRRGWRVRQEMRERHTDPQGGSVPLHYYQGLNHLINERPDLAIDTFIDGMDVSDDSVDMHLALGVLVRRRGEVDKAIRIHQNLLARPVLSSANRERVELELARDYLAAGLLDRAENLLQEIAGKSRELRDISLGHLLEVYQQERDWPRAIEVGEKLARGDAGVRAQIAQFHCEQAEASLSASNFQEARRLLAEARRWDTLTPRVGLLSARVALAAGQAKEARKHLARVAETNPPFAQETLALYQQACATSGGNDEYERYLRKCLEQTDSVEVVAELARVIEISDGPDAARALVSEQLLKKPSQSGFLELLNRISQVPGGVDDQIQALAEITERLVAGAAHYRCDNCGFQTRSLTWHFPSCKRWGTVAPKPDDGLST